MEKFLMPLSKRGPVNRRRQIFEDEDRMKTALDAIEKENRTLKELAARLFTLVIRKVTGKK